MAFQGSNFSLLALRVLPGCGEHLKKILSEEWYLLNNWYTLEDNTLVKRQEVGLERILYGENISVSAVVGKNGSGKSSLMELIYRLVNNLDFCMMQGRTTAGAWPLLFIEKLRVELYFESEGQLGCLTCMDFNVSFKWGESLIAYEADNLQGGHNDETKEQMTFITRHFCYNLVANYALLSLNPGDYQRDTAFPLDAHKESKNWLDSIYNKNDGYTAAIGIEPYKGGGQVDLYNQKKLCRARLVGMLIDSHRRGIDFFDGYSYHSITLRFNEQFMHQQANEAGTAYKGEGSHLDIELPHLLENSYSFVAVILDAFGISGMNMKDAVVRTACAYLAFKTLHVARIYPKYDKYEVIGKERYFSRDTRVFDKRKYFSVGKRGSEKQLRELVADVLNDHSHITQKIRQTLNFLKMIAKKYQREGHEWRCPVLNSYEEYIQLFSVDSGEYGHIFDTFDSIMDYFPPPIYSTNIFLNRKKRVKGRMGTKTEKVPYNSLSSGEQQFIQTVVSIIYHIRNIVSVPDIRGAAKYYNINLFIDEVEACFHPEYQQRFLKLFLGMLKAQKLTDKCNFNIVIATHSPFILSDIPRTNVLYLEEGKNARVNEQMINPFCGNVCDMLKNSFFLEHGFMGEWAKDTVNDLILYLETVQNKETKDACSVFSWDKERAKDFICMIGEPILKGSLMNEYSKAFSEKDDDMIKWHLEEIARLTQIRHHEKNHDNT